ncbi:dolichyl-phosphate-mannose-protein mannosyltransferase [Anaerolinea thermolimosa]|uniref:glycosyltransferase family 39 protein n=1 Tax=Anaerolinea thermolimosa TaxID=229919 RepID=UPI0007825D22|nr:glycosyltransferase family 39 protein [Anaerolinea thermolimosa]GAP06261.1 dolichyl-phosphate-mannose-protein mannosyltransferase [Anaerolinea thermolimosa]
MIPLRAFRSLAWPRWMPLTFILVGGLLIRLVNIQSRGIQYDDAFSIFLAQRNLGEIIQGTAADTMPPLYYFLLHFWMRMGQSTGFLRILSVVLSMGGVVLVYCWVAEMTNESSALWAALLMAISPFQYYHAQDLRNYALLQCAQLGYFFFFYRILRDDNLFPRKRAIAWVGLVLFGVVAMYTHNVAGIGLILPDLFLILKRKWKTLIKLVLAQGVIALAALPWLLYVPGQVAKIQAAWWQGRPGLVEWIQIPVIWVTGLPLQGFWLALGVFLGLETLALVTFAWVRNRVSEDGLDFLAFICCGLPLILFVLSYFVKPIFIPRAFIVAHSAFLALSGWVISHQWKQGVGKLILGGFLLGAIIGIPNQAFFDQFPRSPFQQAATDLSAEIGEGEVVVHDNKLSYFPFRFYAPSLPQEFIEDIPGSGNDTFAPGSQLAMGIFPKPDLESAIGNCRRVYFIVFTQTIQEYRDLGEAEHPSLLWLRSRYRQVAHRFYNDLEVYVFEKP